MNPPKNKTKPLGDKGLLIFVSIFISILLCKVGSECVFVAVFIPFGHMGIDAVHGGSVCPTADFHGGLSRDPERVAQGCEGMP